jgi:hypothetical protein
MCFKNSNCVELSELENLGSYDDDPVVCGGRAIICMQIVFFAAAAARAARCVAPKKTTLKSFY